MAAYESKRRGPVMGPEPIPKAEYDARWQKMWAEGLQPGEAFDAAGPSPALVDAIKTGRVAVAGTRVLVPGCGRGYDCALFASEGAKQTTGLEISTTAVAAAQEYLSKQALPANSTQVVLGDFFEYSNPAGPFDLGFDYNFACALHPTMRSDWAANWARHIAPGGTLVTLIFPVRPDAPLQGPPFPISPELFAELLGLTFTCQTVTEVPASLSIVGRGGMEWFGVWVRK